MNNRGSSILHLPQHSYHCSRSLSAAVT